MFNSPKLRELQRFVLDVTRGGLQVAAQEKLYTLISSIEADAATGASTSVNETFPTFNSFKQAIVDDLDAAVMAEGWRKVTVTEEGETYNAYFRPVLDVLMALLDGRRVVKLWSGDEGPAPPSDRRETPMDGDAFRLCEAMVCDRLCKSCVLGLHVFSDSTHISWSGGMTFRPLGRPSEEGRGCCLRERWESAGWWFRGRVPDSNLVFTSSRRVFAFWARFFFPPAGSTQTLSRSSTGDVEWFTVAYIPIVQTLKEASAAKRGKQRRCGVLQRVPYMVFRTAIHDSHAGVQIDGGACGKVLAFLRILLYVCDQPEERAVLCLKAGSCHRPCSGCYVAAADMVSADALDTANRDAINTLDDHLESAAHARYHREAPRRMLLEARHSLNSAVPALAAMAGLGTAPNLLYKMVGFDILHERFRACFPPVSVSFMFCLVTWGTTVLFAFLLGKQVVPVACTRFFWTWTLTRLRPSARLLGMTYPRATLLRLCNAQVLDLGVTQMLARRLVLVYPYMCKGNKPLHKSVIAAVRAARRRLDSLGRRSLSRATAPG